MNETEDAYSQSSPLSYGVLLAWIAMAAAMGLLFILAATGAIHLG